MNILYVILIIIISFRPLYYCCKKLNGVIVENSSNIRSIIGFSTFSSNTIQLPLEQDSRQSYNNNVNNFQHKATPSIFWKSPIDDDTSHTNAISNIKEALLPHKPILFNPKSEFRTTVIPLPKQPKVIDTVTIFKSDRYLRERHIKTLHSRVNITISSSVNATIITTTNSISIKILNTFSSFKYFKEVYGVTPLVFTDEKKVEKQCIKMGILVRPIPEANPFDLPLIKAILLQAKNTSPSDFYIFLNSDILLNPHVIASLSSLKELIPSPSMYCGRVIITRTIPKKVNYRNPKQFKELHQLNVMLRGYNEVDYFIFSHNFPFHRIPPVVVGRWGVDSALLMTAHEQHVSILDMTHLRSYHQGLGNSKSGKKKISAQDWDWNFQFINKNETKTKGALLSNYLLTSKKYIAYK